jgi:hypothetical protein
LLKLPLGFSSSLAFFKLFVEIGDAVTLSKDVKTGSSLAICPIPSLASAGNKADGTKSLQSINGGGGSSICCSSSLSFSEIILERLLLALFESQH